MRNVVEGDESFAKEAPDAHQRVMQEWHGDVFLRDLAEEGCCDVLDREDGADESREVVQRGRAQLRDLTHQVLI